MYKRLSVLLVALLLIFTVGCGEDKGVESTQEEESAIFTNSHAIEALGLDFFFVPEKSTGIKVSEGSVSAVQVSFNGCGYKEINEYAADLEREIINKGYQLFAPVCNTNGVVTDIVKAESISAVIENESYAGVAYGFIYKKEQSFISLDISYYGSAGGEYGNGLCKVNIKDNTALYAKYSEELENE